eukprot:GHVQ01015927.1.p2 GENE.GHVQ01015927.1~~GHVQ01015927.1.p2  ORF type:complete len:131 (-),score=29.86 GHVQ01015927.1:1195-1587(-)
MPIVVVASCCVVVHHTYWQQYTYTCIISSYIRYTARGNSKLQHSPMSFLIHSLPPSPSPPSSSPCSLHSSFNITNSSNNITNSSNNITNSRETERFFFHIHHLPCQQKKFRTAEIITLHSTTDINLIKDV